MIPLIGLAGKARTGKDTVADLIIEHQGGFRYSFADPIREMLIPLGIDLRMPEWQKMKETEIPLIGKSPRYLMQTLGTEWGRNMVCEDLWLRLAAHKLKYSDSTMVVADVRFENEAEWIRQNGGLLIHIFRDDAPSVRAHPSEAGVMVKKGDRTIHNDGSLLDLAAKVHALLSSQTL